MTLQKVSWQDLADLGVFRVCEVLGRTYDGIEVMLAVTVLNFPPGRHSPVSKASVFRAFDINAHRTPQRGPGRAPEAIKGFGASSRYHSFFKKNTGQILVGLKGRTDFLVAPYSQTSYTNFV